MLLGSAELSIYTDYIAKSRAQLQRGRRHQGLRLSDDPNASNALSKVGSVH
jgi:hypothetical protein